MHANNPYFKRAPLAISCDNMATKAFGEKATRGAVDAQLEARMACGSPIPKVVSHDRACSYPAQVSI